MAPVGIGLVGAGMVGQMCHLANFVAIPGCRVVALAELRPELGRRAAAKFRVPRVYATHRELLGDRDVDAVVVVTRRAATGPIVLDALTSGRHVLSEKPMAHTLEQAQRLVEAASARRRVYAIGYMKRHDPGVARAKALVERALGEGSLGRLRSARTWCLGGDTGAATGSFVMSEEPRPEGLVLWPIAPDWLPGTLAAEYDWFLNVHSHMINLMRYFLGRSAMVTESALGNRRAGQVRIDFGGVPVVMEIGEVESDAWHEGLELEFEHGAIRVDLPAPFRREAVARVTLRREDAAAEPVAIAGEPVWAFRRQAEAFVADVAAGRAPLASGEDSIEDLKVAEAIWRQHAEGRPVVGR